MSFEDLFKPYSPQLRGELENYLREHDGTTADNLFHGPEYFFIIRDRGFLIPGSTFIRVDQSPVPDVGYFVNSDYLLESKGVGKPNMSLVGAEKGVYDPQAVLKNKNWSIYNLNL
ncbi:MAG: hypothetical protein RL557_636 [archaeon]|jgi:hypothetical protein